MSNKQCPNCQSFKTTRASKKALFLSAGLLCVVVGMALTIFLIGIPIFFLGLTCICISLFLKEDGKMRCRTCNFIYYSK